MTILLRLFFIFTITVLAGSQAQVSTPVKWACIGNSITAGEYPGKLATYLGTSYKVQNDGMGGTTLLKSGKNTPTDAPGAWSYWKYGHKLDSVFAFKPDIITIALGTNDSKAMNWQDSANFIRDYTALIDTLSLISSKPQIWLILPCPAWVPTSNPPDISGSTIKNSIIPRIKQLAAAKNLNTIDLNTPMTNFQGLFPDNVHPNSAGADSLAALIYRAYAVKAMRIACIGNSITQYGPSSDVPDIDAYPSKLGMLLGRGYLVQNDGYSGAAMQRKNAGWSYWVEAANKFSQIFKFKPNVVTIKLGTNDSRRNYWHTAPYIADYKAMIDTLNNNIAPKPIIKPCLPIPAWPSGFVKYGINDTIIRDSVVPAIKLVALAKGLSIIDLNTPMQSAYPALVPATDGVHPNAAGQDTLAHLIYRNFTIASMQLSAQSFKFTAFTGQTDTVGTKKVDTVSNNAIAGTLAAVVISHKSTWLSCANNALVPNSQKITNALVLGSLPAGPGSYFDTVTITAANAVPASIKYAVTLELQQGTGAFARPALVFGGAPEITISKAGRIGVITHSPGRHTICLLTIAGEIISLRIVNGIGEYKLPPKTYAPGVCIVRVASQSGQTVSRRIVNIDTK
jgi:acyl-CoA thioesterase-1